MNTNRTVKRTFAALALSSLFAISAFAQSSAPDIIVGAGAGGTNAQGGVNIAVGDVNGDGTDIVEELPPAQLGLLNPEASCAEGPERMLSVGTPAIVAGAVSFVSQTLTQEDAAAKLANMLNVARPNESQNPVIPKWTSNPWGHPAFVVPESLGGDPIEDQMQDGFLEVLMPVDMDVEIVSGPICTTRYGLNSYGEPVAIIMTWWKGNLPEANLNNVWLAETLRAVIGGNTHLRIDYRLIQPVIEITQLDPLTLDPCGATDETWLYAGLNVEPARGPMNVRSTPNGAIIGRFNPGEVRQLVGEPECGGGTLWWPTLEGGWIAEFAPIETTAAIAIPSLMKNARKAKSTEDQPVALLLPAIQNVQPAETETPAAEQPPVVVQPPVIVVTPTPRPERPTDPTRPPQRPGQPGTPPTTAGSNG